MEAEDEMIVVIVGDDDDIVWEKQNDSICMPINVKEEPLDRDEVTDMIAIAQRYGKPLEHNLSQGEEVYVHKDQLGNLNFIMNNVTIKMEAMEEGDLEYCNDEEYSHEPNVIVKEEAKGEEDLEYYDDDEEYIPAGDEEDSDEYTPDHDNEFESKSRKRVSMVPPALQKSFVDELRQSYPELKKDEKKLIKTIAEIMRNTKAPRPPRDFFVMNNINFECAYCGIISNCIPATARHYQEKHGPRYLMCFACGVDFRSKTNLYKHEKRCQGKDAEVLLKARAQFLGRKGRSRPYLPDPSTIPVLKPKNNKRFPCSQCSATFKTNVNLLAHENMHRGFRPFVCEKCPCAYTSLSALSRHKQIHSDQQYICDHCQRVFKVKTTLVAHLDTHKAVPRYGCDLCPKRFSTKNALNHHIRRVHLNLPMPCACQICPKRYPRMSLLRDHMKKMHGVALMTRKMFFKALPRLTPDQLVQAKDILKGEGPLLNLSANIDTMQEEARWSTVLSS